MIEKLKACIADENNVHIFSKDDLRKIVALLEAGEKYAQDLLEIMPLIGWSTTDEIEGKKAKALAAYEVAKGWVK